MTPKLHNVSNPAAWGVEFELEPGGTRHQFVVSHPGGTEVIFGSRQPGRGWVIGVVSNPWRFGPIPTSYKELVAWAEAFNAAGAER